MLASSSTSTIIAAPTVRTALWLLGCHALWILLHYGLRLMYYRHCHANIFVYLLWRESAACTLLSKLAGGAEAQYSEAFEGFVSGLSKAGALWWTGGTTQ